MLARAFSRIVGRRFAARAFTAEPVDPAVLRDCLSMTQRAPSSFNTQPWVAIVVTSEQRKAALAAAMLGDNGSKVRAAPVTVVFAADMESSKLTDRVVKLAVEGGAPRAFTDNLPLYISMFGGGHQSALVRNAAYGLKAGLLNAVRPMLPTPPKAPSINAPEAWAYKNTSFAAMTYMLAAAAHGLDTAPMEGFDADAVHKALGLPERYSVPLIVATGYAQAATPPSPRSRRFAPEEVYFDDSYGISYEGIPQFAEVEDGEGGERTHEREGEGHRAADDGKKKKTRKKTTETADGPQ